MTGIGQPCTGSCRWTDSDRMSIPYFFNPRIDAVIAPVDELVTSDSGTSTPAYRPFVFRDFISARGADNYADAGTADAQISDYRIPT